MKIFNYELIKKDDLLKLHKEIKDLKEEKDKDFFSYNKIIQDYKNNVDFNYTKKLNQLKSEIKKEENFLKYIKPMLEKPVIADPDEYKKWLECYYYIKEKILSYKL